MQPHEISNERLAQIAAEAAAKLPELICEREREILADFHSAVQDSHDDDGKLPKLKLGFALDFDLQTNALELALKWSVSRKATATLDLGDPNQAKLPL